MIDIAAIIEDGVVDASEAAAIRADIYADGTIDQEEADILFQINDAVSGNANDPAWQALFVDGLCDFVLADENTPGVIDQDEADYLVGKIQGDGQIDDAEKALLVALKVRAIGTIPANLVELMN